MNINLKRLCQINFLLDEIIYIDLKFHIGIQTQIKNLIKKIKLNIDFLISEFYFTNIVEFESKKKIIIQNLIFCKNIFYTYNTSNYIISKIIYIINIVKQVIYPVFLNISNTNKYIDEINEIKKVKFYHKPSTIGIKDNFYDEEIDFEIENEIISSIKKKKKSQNNKNHVISKIKGKELLSKINFKKSFITI